MQVRRRVRGDGRDFVLDGKVREGLGLDALRVLQRVRRGLRVGDRYRLAGPHCNRRTDVEHYSGRSQEVHKAGRKGVTVDLDRECRRVGYRVRIRHFVQEQNDAFTSSWGLRADHRRRGVHGGGGGHVRRVAGADGVDRRDPVVARVARIQFRVRVPPRCRVRVRDQIGPAPGAGVRDLDPVAGDGHTARVRRAPAEIDLPRRTTLRIQVRRRIRDDGREVVGDGLGGEERRDLVARPSPAAGSSRLSCRRPHHIAGANRRVDGQRDCCAGAVQRQRVDRARTAIRP